MPRARHRPGQAPGDRGAAGRGSRRCIDFFGTRLAKELRRRGPQGRLIIANNVVAHVADQNDLVAGMAELLADDGIVVGRVSLRPGPDRLHRVRHDLSRAPVLLLGRLGQDAVRAPRASSQRRAPPADPRRLAPALFRQDSGAVRGGGRRFSPRRRSSASTLTTTTRASARGCATSAPRRASWSASSRPRASASPPTARRPRARSCSTSST